LLRVCEKYLLWNEVVFLYENYNEADNAVKTMIEHSPTCFKHDRFVQIVQKVNSSDVLYKSIQFYIDEEPRHLNELLRIITKSVDLGRVVDIVNLFIINSLKEMECSQLFMNGFREYKAKTTRLLTML